MSVATKDRWFLRATALSGPNLWALCRLPLPGWAVVGPRHFHFTITALTVDRGSSSRVKSWRTGLLERWHTLSNNPVLSQIWTYFQKFCRPVSGLLKYNYSQITGVVCYILHASSETKDHWADQQYLSTQKKLMLAIISLAGFGTYGTWLQIHSYD